jgi:phosphoglycolate phosphatase
MKIKKMLLFDIDGTLLLTGGTGALAFNQVFKEMFGLENAWGGCVPDGKTDPAIVDELAQANLGRSLTSVEYDSLCERYLQLFNENIHEAPRFRLMPGVPELLSELTARPELALGVATGNFEKVAWSKLERGRIRHHFRFGGFGSDSLHRPELTRRAMQRGHEIIGRELSPEDIVVIGDTIWDIHAGKHIGALTIGVTTGSYRQDDFRHAGADFIFSDLSDLAGFLKILQKI